MGNVITSSVLSSFKVKFSRETPNDFYLSGDRVYGIIEIVTHVNDENLDFRHGPLYVELMGELQDFKINTDEERNASGAQIFFRKRAQVIKLPNDNQQTNNNHHRTHRWLFDGQLDSLLPSSLPSDNVSNPYICYYARIYLHRADLSRKFFFIVFTRTAIPVLALQSLQNYDIEASVQHKNVKLHATLPNNGLVVPGQTHMLQIEIDNPMKVTIKSIRVTLKQYRNITNQETDFTIFSIILPGFKPKGLNCEYHQSTYELSIPLEKCGFMAPTSSYKNVRYELHIQCHIHCLFNSHFTLILPIICTTDHRRTLQIMDELKSLPEILQHLSTNEEEEENPPPPSYENFIASEILPKYEDAIH